MASKLLKKTLATGSEIVTSGLKGKKKPKKESVIQYQEFSHDELDQEES